MKIFYFILHQYHQILQKLQFKFLEHKYSVKRNPKIERVIEMF